MEHPICVHAGISFRNAKLFCIVFIELIIIIIRHNVVSIHFSGERSQPGK